MSFLAPLYLLGALAVGLPILFHLIRRTPRGRQVFSSIMFLEPSPPRIAKRSRIEHWLLLILRALAICLLAAAFARPFLREPAGTDLNEGEGRWIVVLLDTSASMRRENVWDEARDTLRDYVDDLSPGDRLEVLTFDDAPVARFSFDAWNSLSPGQRAAAVENALDGVEPTWRETDLGRALVYAADRLADAAVAEQETSPREVAIVSDLQGGSRLDALHSYEWPEEFSVTLLRVGESLDPTNAGIQLVAEMQSGDTEPRVRVSNAAHSGRETFQLRWASSDNNTDEDSVDVYVPPGQSRVVVAPKRPPGNHTRLVLDGDAHDFDNNAYVARHVVSDVTIVYLGSDDPQDTSAQRFYLSPLFPATRDREVSVVDWPFESAELPEGEGEIPLVVVTEPPLVPQLETLREYIALGGCVVYVPGSSEAAAAVYDLLETAPAETPEADVADYAMLADVDFDHTIFAPFADPRFSDFTKLRFWRHRRFDPASLPDCRVLARFDDGDPALVEIPKGAGRVMLFASGWSRADSQLAVWSKFVPLMNGLLEYAAGHVQRQPHRLVGDPVPLRDLGGSRQRWVSVETPAGAETTFTEDSEVFAETDDPGIYLFRADDFDEARVAINLEPSESRTEALDVELLAASGVTLSGGDAAAANPDLQRQLQNRELEGRQKLWRWLVLAALGVLALETIIAGRLAVRRPASE